VAVLCRRAAEGLAIQLHGMALLLGPADREKGQADISDIRTCVHVRPRGCRNTFADVYGTDLRKAVEEFQLEVRSGRVVPPVPRGGPQFVR